MVLPWRCADCKHICAVKLCHHEQHQLGCCGAVLVAYTVVVLPFRAAFFWEYYHQLDMYHHLWQQLQVLSCPSPMCRKASGCA